MLLCREDGRLTKWHWEATTVLNNSLLGHGLEQIFHISRTVTVVTAGKLPTTSAYCIMSRLSQHNATLRLNARERARHEEGTLDNHQDEEQ